MRKMSYFGHQHVGVTQDRWVMAMLWDIYKWRHNVKNPHEKAKVCNGMDCLLGKVNPHHITMQDPFYQIGMHMEVPLVLAVGANHK